jgi:hypothetical protein
MKTYWEEHPKRTFAFHRFKRAHTEVSDFYWGLKLHRIMAAKFTAPYTIADKISAAVSFGSGEERRYPVLFGDWKKMVAPSESWIRRSVLLSANSYLEKYLHEISSIAIMADPGVLLNVPKGIDGLFFLKRNILPRGIDVVKSITSGEWSSRMSVATKIFKELPNFDGAMISDLEHIRKLRNKIAHRNGFDFVDDPPIEILETDAESISEATLLIYLGVIENVAVHFERVLLPKHIGHFEILYYWHKCDKKALHPKHDEDFKKIRAAVGLNLKIDPMPKTRARQLIKLYKNAA